MNRVALFQTVEGQVQPHRNGFGIGLREYTAEFHKSFNAGSSLTLANEDGFSYTTLLNA